MTEEKANAEMNLPVYDGGLYDDREIYRHVKTEIVIAILMHYMRTNAKTIYYPIDRCGAVAIDCHPVNNGQAHYLSISSAADYIDYKNYFGYSCTDTSGGSMATLANELCMNMHEHPEDVVDDDTDPIQGLLVNGPTRDTILDIYATVIRKSKKEGKSSLYAFQVFC